MNTSVLPKAIRASLRLLLCLFALAARAANPNLQFVRIADVVPWPTATTPTVLMDVNRDGKQDLVRLIPSQTQSQLSVQRGAGNGTFGTPTFYAVGQYSTAMVSAFFTGDAYADLVVADGSSKSLGLVPGVFDGSLNPPIVSNIGLVVRSIAVTDFDKNGRLDVIVAGYQNDPREGYVMTLKGNANGTFGNPVPTAIQAAPRTPYTETSSVAVGDFNGDTWPDFVVANPRSGATIRVFLNNQNGTFTPQTEVFLGNVPGQLATGDFNGDGKADIAFTTIVNSDYGASLPGVLLGVGLSDGSGTFNFAYYEGQDDVITNPAANLIATDLDGDGLLDIAMTASAVSTLNSRVVVFRGAANGSFSLATQFIADYLSAWISIADLNNDGAPDPVVSRNDPNTQIYMGVPPGGTNVVVTTAVDEDNGTIAANAGTGTSLREAMNYVATRLGPQTITFAANMAGQTIQLTTVGDNSQGPSAFRIPSAADITIQGITTGAGVTISGGNTLRPFFIDIAFTGANATLTLNDLTITGGRAQYGGAFFNFGTLKLNRCTLTGNTATSTGCALYNGAPWAPAAEAFITNSTIAGNSGLVAGGIMNERALTLSYTTIAGNSSVSDGGLLNTSTGVVSLANCIIAGNSRDITGTNVLASSHHNLIGNGGSGGLTNGVNGNIVGVASPGLQALAANGGPTKTVALAVGSPAINAGAAVSGITTDQRGIARPQGSAPDIGALESRPTAPAIISANAAAFTAGIAGSFQLVATGEPAPSYTKAGTLPSGVTLSATGLLSGTPALTSTGIYNIIIAGSNGTLPDATQSFILIVRENPTVVTTVNDIVSDVDLQTSLREALTYANIHAGPDTITFSPALAGQTVTLDTGWNGGGDGAALRVSSEVAVQGLTGSPGVTIAMASGVTKQHIVVESSGNLTVSHLAFTNGSGDYGGSIGNFGTVAVRNCTFVGNHANLDGGAVYSSDGSPSLSLENCTFTGNNAASNANTITTGALQANFRHLTITNNTGGSCAILLLRNPATMVNSLIAGNGPDDVLVALGGTFSAASTNNILGSGGTGGLVNGASDNFTGVATNALRLSAFASNGGPTQTVALLPGSLAVNNGVAIAGITTDQRGNGRSVGSAPDIGAFEEPAGSDDADGDTLPNVQEYQMASNPASIDSDSDGFNDATELMASSNPNSAASIPPTTHIERVLGFGTARGLDLTGNFKYAINVGITGQTGPAGDAFFTADSIAGATVTAPNEIVNWAPRDFSGSETDLILKEVFRSMRWANIDNSNAALRSVQVDLANLVAGRRYKLQLLFAESTNHDRTFDVLVDGTIIVAGFNTNTAQGTIAAASAVVHEFTASTSTLHVELSGLNTPGTADHNPLLNGATLELLPTALESWRTLQSLAADGSQDLANPSGDGIANVLKFAFNLASNAGQLATPNATVLPKNGTAGLPFITRDAQGRLFIEFVRHKTTTNSGIAYVVETGSDLTNLLPLDLSGANIVSIDATSERVTIIDPTITSQRFGRVLVSILP